MVQVTDPGATRANVDQAEVHKFEQLATRWWDPEGDFRPLHELNPVRLHYLDTRVGLSGKRIADVGCGGGILAEAMAQRGASVVGVDASASSLRIARLHQLESGTQVEYRLRTAEEFAREEPGRFDVVTCMELLEHVPTPMAVVRACAQLVRPGGQVFFSTLNRNFKSYLFAILGAEYILGWLPRGTHDYGRFIRPSELDSWARLARLTLRELMGVSYHPLTRTYYLSKDIDVNYLAWLQSPEDA
jgi:2-polyprenyl-6-hydroxyphenyl methylase/3-demethylubiquinone-9 3-methyltransferase